MIYGKSIKKYYIQNWYWFLIGVVTIALIDYLQLLIPGLIGQIVDGLENLTIDMDGIISILMTMAIYVLIIMAGRFIWRMSILGASRRFDYGLRNDMFAHAEKLSNEFYSEHKVGGLMAYFTNDIETVRRTVGFGMVMVVDALFMGGLAIYRMYLIDATLTLFTAVPMFVIAIVGSHIGRKMRSKFKEAQKAFEDLSDYTNESLSGIRVIKAFVKEMLDMRQFLSVNANAKQKNIEFVRMQAMLDTFVRTFISLIFVIILGYGGYLVYITNELGAASRLTPGRLVEFFYTFNLLIWPMMAIGRIINMRSRGKASLQRIETILDEPIDVKDADDVLDIDTLHGDIEFRHMTFRYPDGKTDVLKDINFHIKAGETVGILGRTGSGKTSIVDLLLRIYNVEEGSIFLDGHDIMKLPLVTVRDSIGYVPQDGFLFSDSIRNNISLSFSKNPTLHRDVEQAATLSAVHDNIVEFSDGYDTVIGERGVTLSGGQRQRVAIARALIKNSPIMILDDSVSAVDTSTEVTILKNLKQVRKGKTTLLIAHRITTIKSADKIIIVDNGEVLDVGSHDELYERCEFYRDMVERQRLEDEMEVQE